MLAGVTSISITSRTTYDRLTVPLKSKAAQPAWLKTRLRRKSTKKRLIRTGIVAGNIFILGAVLYLVMAQPFAHSATTPKTTAAAITPGTDNLAPSPLDQLASASIAETAAKLTGVAEVTPITNQADSEEANISQAATTDETVSSKPQVVASTYASNKDIHSYTVQAGDTVESIAAKFGITSDSVRWSNNLTGSAVSPGTKLNIPPVNGIVYTVGNGDTVQTLAAKYNISPDKLTQYNDAEIGGLHIGELIILPDAVKSAPVVRSSGSSSSFGSFSGSASYGYNGYDFGYCTWWVATLRAKAGNPLPSNLGNASTWARRAAAFGLATGTTPRVGAAVVTSTSREGHVAYVLAVNPDGSILISEMNHVGWNRTDTRTLSGNFSYIY